MAETISRRAAFAIALVVFALDRWSKYAVETRLGAFDSRQVIPGFFDIVRSQNPGVAFGLFSQSSSPYRTAALILFSLAAVAILARVLWRINRLDRVTAMGIALIFGGALGNVFDRVRLGTVTDFLDFYVGNIHWYTFNLADTAICAGAGLLLIRMWKPSRSLDSARPDSART